MALGNPAQLHALNIRCLASATDRKLVVDNNQYGRGEAFHFVPCFAQPLPSIDSTIVELYLHSNNEIELNYSCVSIGLGTLCVFAYVCLPSEKMNNFINFYFACVSCLVTKL